MARKLTQLLEESPFQGYAYSYPHKTAYREFDAPMALDALWEGEDTRALFLYLHIPFCEMRCGFCNLFTSTNPDGGLVTRYLDALDVQIEATVTALGPHRFARAAFGGGTPTFLTAGELARVFDSLGRLDLAAGMPASFEMSPATVDAEKLALLKERGVTRASIGVQSFVEAETRALGRPQKRDELVRALGLIRDAHFPVFNIDLIYGAVGQTVESWLGSLRAAMEFAPEELFLYPLYVRPLTGLGRKDRKASDAREALYEAGRDFLFENGYLQISMRLFRKSDCADESAALEGATYCCQEDGMVGLGAGARSYTGSVHYSSEWAVGREGVVGITRDFIERTPEQHALAHYGCRLSPDEQRRRYLIKSLLRIDGLDSAAYSAEFGALPEEEFSQLAELEELGLARTVSGRLQLTAAGLGRSDTIGPWLYSDEVERGMGEFIVT